MGSGDRSAGSLGSSRPDIQPGWDVLLVAAGSTRRRRPRDAGRGAPPATFSGRRSWKEQRVKRIGIGFIHLYQFLFSVAAVIVPL